MSNVVVIEHMTLDGVIQAPARPDEDTRDGFPYGGWAAESGSDPALQQAIGAHMGSVWSLLVGRVTYEDLASVWPNQPQPNPFTDVLNNVQKFVASTTLTQPLPWQNSTLLKGDAADAVATLRRDHEKTLVVFGSGALVQSLMRRDLIDEYVLQVHPVVLGTGRRLFAEGASLTRCKLVEMVTTASGVLVVTYQPTSAANLPLG